jgi:hypothetical protein
METGTSTIRVQHSTSPGPGLTGLWRLTRRLKTRLTGKSGAAAEAITGGRSGVL